jgi:ubiquinone/menaquinone biosynthesis C-methylase UbiE/uncharacterized protein YbaR (Trm112 family)
MKNSKLINILCDPVSKEQLLIKNDTIFSSSNQYPIVKDIPVLLIDKKLKNYAIDILNNKKSKVGYSWVASNWNKLNIEKLVKKSSHKQLLLNLGSGTPKEKDKFEKLGYEMISVDINPTYFGVDAICDAHKLPFKDKSFDVVCAFEVLEHLEEPWTAINEINRVLKKNGRFLGSVAFLKEFHSSYFHMSHWGVIKLLEFGGFNISHLYGGQNVYSRLIHNIFPIGFGKISTFIYNFINTIIMRSRLFYWSIKNFKNPNIKLSKFDTKYKFSFKEYDKIKFSPTILFDGKKIK